MGTRVRTVVVSRILSNLKRTPGLRCLQNLGGIIMSILEVFERE